MKAAFTPAYGPATILDVREVPITPLGATQVRVQVRASPVTAGDLRLRSADFPGIAGVLGRLMIGILRPNQPVQGTMFAGRVVEVGSEVTRFAVGDAVFGQVDAGAWAESVVVDADGAIAHTPDNVTDDAGAAIPYGAGTAIHFLKHLAGVQQGERVLILGGSGGVGRYAIQVAKRLGAHVTAVGSGRSLEAMRALGADVVLDHRTHDVAQLDERFDVVFDIADATRFGRMRPLLREGGRYLTLHMSLRIFWQTLVTSLGRGPRAIFAVALGDRENTEEIAAWMASDALTPTIAERYPLDRIAEAHRAAEARRDGVVLVNPSPPLLSSHPLVVGIPFPARSCRGTAGPCRSVAQNAK